MSGLLKRSFSLAGHRTSVALEPEFWAVLDAMAAEAGRSLVSLVGEIDLARTQGTVPDRPLASALRVHALLATSASSRNVNHFETGSVPNSGHGDETPSPGGC